VCRRFRIRLRKATIGVSEEDRRIFMLHRSLFTFRPICVLDEYLRNRRAISYSLYMIYVYICTGGFARKGYLRRKVTVTLLIIKLSTWFLSQIAEDRETRLSKSFFGPGDDFSKGYDENQIRTVRYRAYEAWSGGCWVTSRSQITSRCSSIVWQMGFVITLRKVIPRTKKWSRKTRLMILYNLR
jgi:hypothetical protein